MAKKQNTGTLKKASKGKGAADAPKEVVLPYHLSSAKAQAADLKSLVVVKLSRAFDERGFSQRQAAEYLRVSQPRISDLMRGNTNLFSLDTLIEWMLALDKPVTITFDFKKEWGRSSPQEWSEEDWCDKLAYLDKVIKYNPDNREACRQRAYCHYRLKQYDRSIADYGRCLEIDAADHKALQMRAMVYSHAGHNEAALKDFDELLRQSPDHDAYQNRALVYLAMNDLENALKDCSEAIARMKTQRPGPYWNRAVINEKLGRYDEAIADCRKVLESDPTYKIAIEKIEALQKTIAGR
jgi:tetratricopeptide (TPR) repeat protein